jgi:hypothetical protein
MKTTGKKGEMSFFVKIEIRLATVTLEGIDSNAISNKREK